MLRRFSYWSTSAAVLGMLCMGCHGGSFALHVQEERPARVRHVHRSHVCTQACHDHYYDGARVVVIGGGHRHGPDCGHHWDGHYWVVVRRSHPHRRAPHVCSRDCHHHYYDGAKLVVIGGGHRHGRSCGHHWDGHHWVVVRKSHPRKRVRHVCTRECHHHYHDGAKLVVIGGGHRHGRKCGHKWNGKHWVLARRSHPERRVRHVCTRECHHHYHDGAKVVTIRGGHKHGRGCGHNWNGTHWVVAGKRETRERDRSEPRRVRPRKRDRGRR